MIKFSIIAYDLDSIETSKKYTVDSFMKEYATDVDRFEPVLN
jgi:hypothetical protein